MDFGIQYTKEQEAFRQEVRAWMDEHALMPKELGVPPVDPIDTPPAQREWTRAFTRKLGHKGWLYPTFPKDYGGGGLTFDHDLVINEELIRHGQRPTSISPPVGSIMQWGTEEQKREFAVPIVRGETSHWLLWTEPDAGVDLASIKTRAIRDGDEFIFNGQKTYISGHGQPDFFAILAVTDPQAPRHMNLGYFYMPAKLPGASWEHQDLINREGQHNVYFDDARVPSKYLIGPENLGWRVTQSALELEHGAAGGLQGVRGWMRTHSIVKEWQERGQDRPFSTVAHGDRARELLVHAYTRRHIVNLLKRRNFWLHSNHVPQTYEGVQGNWYDREAILQESDDVLGLYGMHCMVRDPEWALIGGHVEFGTRRALMSTHGQGSYEIDKLIISRRIGLSRTAEQAAPTI